MDGTLTAAEFKEGLDAILARLTAQWVEDQASGEGLPAKMSFEDWWVIFAMEVEEHLLMSSWSIPSAERWHDLCPRADRRSATNVHRRGRRR